MRRRGVSRHVSQSQEWFAIRSYVWKLSQDLLRRFGSKRHYAVEQVTEAVQRSGFSQVFIAYAHATFCTRADFDSYYEPLQVACTFDGLRREVGRRFFGGVVDFDAASVVSATKRTDELRPSEFLESNRDD